MPLNNPPGTSLHLLDGLVDSERDFVMANVKAFLLGLREFRLGCTTHFDYPLIENYDAGRELAHRVTFRKWDS